MHKSILLFVGLILLVLQHFLVIFSNSVQFVLFLVGIILLGIPHGAADLMVATQNKVNQKRLFSVSKFFAAYLARLVLSAAIIYFFPLTGISLFVLLAAYHFGQTDLEKIPSDHFSKYLFTIAYGLLVLSAILLHHFDEVKPLYHLFYSGGNIPFILTFIDLNRLYLQVASLMFCLTSALLYIVFNLSQLRLITGTLWKLMLLVVIVYNLPMLLGFTFYFIMWHSLSSLCNIIVYLERSGSYTIHEITRQIVVYSLLAIAGIVLGGVAGYMFIDDKAIIIYTLLGLAVLTTPHMQVMNEMYVAIASPETPHWG